MSRYDIPDPKCNHTTHAVRVSSHSDLVAASKTDEPMVSVWVCSRVSCVEDAREWVYAKTHRQAVIVRRKAAS